MDRAFCPVHCRYRSVEKSAPRWLSALILCESLDLLKYTTIFYKKVEIFLKYGKMTGAAIINNLLLACVLCIFITLDFGGADVCDSPQYMEMETTGIINCSFEDGFEFVLWYNSTNEENEQPILRYRKSSKSGMGFTSGEFDVKTDGSLVINKVGVQHEHYFTAVYVHPNIEGVTTIVVFVAVTVKPTAPCPTIGEYNESMRNLDFLVAEKPSLVCFVEKVRPEVPLLWMVRTYDGDRNISFIKNRTQWEYLYTTQVSTDNVFVYSTFLSLMVCKSKGLPDMFREGESLLLVQNGNLNFENEHHIVKTAEIGSRLELICSGKEIGFLVWRKFMSSRKLNELLAYAVYLTKNITRIITNEYQLGNSGILILPEVNVHHDGMQYRCISGNGVNDDVSAYEVLVYTNPEPTYTVVKGCEHAQYCNLEAYDSGHLTCTLKGIRPKVQLEINTYYQSDSSSITFMNQQMVAKDNGETFDLILTTEYRIRDKSTTNLAIECKLPGLHENLFNLTRIKVNLQFKREEGGVESCSRTLLVFILSTNVIILLIFLFYFGRKLLKRTTYTFTFSSSLECDQQGTLTLSTQRKETTL